MLSYLRILDNRMQDIPLAAVLRSYFGNMTDEELADEILKWFNWLNAVEWDEDRIINWLKREAET